MNFAILEVNSISIAIKNAIENIFNPVIKQQGGEEISIAAFLDTSQRIGNFNDTASIEPNQFRAFYRKGLIKKLLIPRENFSGQTNLLSILMALGIDFDDIYLTGRVQNAELFTIEPFLSAKYLPYLEFHIADHCNLNCKGCEHYSGLVKHPRFPNLEKFTRDMEQLHNFIDDVGVIRILGGEPLLNPEINHYVRLTRRLYPKANMYVVTNALLLPSMPDEFFETLRQNEVTVFVSYYKPLVGKLDAVKQFVQSKGVRFFSSALNEKFSVKQTLQRHDQPREMFLNCFQAHCHNLYDGKLAACFLPFTTKYFNAYFDKHLPEDGAIDLYDETLTTEKLKSRLNQPFERCRYCTPPVWIDWTTIKNPSVLSDWINDGITSDQ